MIPLGGFETYHILTITSSSPLRCFYAKLIVEIAVLLKHLYYISGLGFKSQFSPKGPKVGGGLAQGAQRSLNGDQVSFRLLMESTILSFKLVMESTILSSRLLVESTILSSELLMESTHKLVDSISSSEDGVVDSIGGLEDRNVECGIFVCFSDCLGWRQAI